MLVHIVALVFVLAEGQIVSADDNYFLRNAWQKVQKENNKTFKADGSLDQLQIQPNIRKRNQEKVKEEHYRGTPTSLNSLKKIPLLEPEGARHNLKRHFAARRRMLCAPTCPLSR